MLTSLAKKSTRIRKKAGNITLIKLRIRAKIDYGHRERKQSKYHNKADLSQNNFSRPNSKDKTF